MHRRYLVLAIAAVFIAPSRAAVQAADGVVQAIIPEHRDVTRAARLRTAADPADPDTVWIGHVWDQTFTAGGTMSAGGYGPYRVGRGPNLPTRSGGTIGSNGTWDFDRFQGQFAPGGAERDSLQGWWPVARCYQSGLTTFPDYRRAFFGLDHGNQANYVINQGSPKRTFGVTGLWHRDRGNIIYAPSDTMAGTNVQPVLWSATEVGGTGSTASAWMGIRSHGDLSHVDAIANGGTGNPFNSSVMQHQGNNGFNQIGSIHTNGTDHNFPGYGSQLDQMLYRDVVLGEGDGLTLSFNFSTNMSTNKNTTEGIRAGWFDKDPISNAQIGVGAGATPTSDGNFISSSVAGANAPCDSFMVYVGAPVNDDNVVFSAPLFVGGNEITTVYDKKRRWFSEVLQITGPGGIVGKEILSVAGNTTPAAVSLNFGAVYPTELQAIKDADGATGNGGTVRIVFRVKTNRGFDDENGGNPSAAYFSGTRGAAIVDNVVVNGWAAANGNFEAANAINNDTAVSPTNAWKSTGKPPGVYFHAHSVLPGGGLAFNDPCGGLDSPNRQCNLYGKIITSGDHDEAEKDGGLFGSNTQDRQRWFVSPTVNLKSSGNGPGFYNGMGIDDEIARTTGDYDCLFSYYNAGHVNATTATGNFVSMGWQSYPARQANGNLKWGETRHTGSIFFYGTRGCFETTALGGGAKAQGLIITPNPDNRPDSLRLYIHRISRCYTFNLTAATCSPTTGDAVGTYFDNISIMLVDGAPPPAIAINIWDLINDAFPANGNDALVPAGLDTCAAQVRIGLNIAANTGNTNRPSITGDSVVVTATGANVRMDMVFRVLPGPGNYNTIGTKASGVKKRPDAAGAAAPGDGSFFGEYMSNTGEFGSQANHPGGVWNQNIWNSARMDTVERNLFPTANNGSVVGLTPGVWRGSYHESDPKFSTLGITKFICAMTVPGGATNSSNILCDGTNFGAYGAGSGYNGVNTTKEHTKVIPDGLLTPGSHVQYFFRKSNLATPSVFEMGPDTNFVFQPTEGNFDGHRWQQFGVLPDRWKDGAWPIQDRHANAPACMLYIDWSDRRGDEQVWVGIADTAGATSPSRYGAHNGWHARGDQDITVAIATDPSIARYTHGGQPGMIWDMFGVKASESSTTSSSLGSRTTTNPIGFQTGKKTLVGPTGLMLRHYYRILLILTGDLNAGNIGPYVDKGDNDVALLQDFANGVAGTSKPRAVWVMGSGFVEGQIGFIGPSWVPTFFGAGLISGDYRSYAGNTDDIVDLTPNAPIVTNGNRYSVLSSCVIQNDVLSVTGTFGAQIAARYANGTTGTNPKVASIYAPSTFPGSSDHEAMTLVEGFRISSLGTWKTLTSHGRIDYFFNAYVNLFASLNCIFIPGGPMAVGENPNNPLVYYLALRTENPHRGGDARIGFGITRRERVELRIYDVTGRAVRTLANREFTAGEHVVTWDGSDDAGRAVPRGVYFYQLRTPTFVSQKKLAMLSR